MHTKNAHPILALLAEDVARAEMYDGKRALEEIVGNRVTLFAYPNGRRGDDYTDRDVRLVRECGFAAEVSTAWGRLTADRMPTNCLV